LEVAGALLMVVRQQSFFPSQWGWRQGRFASASCRNTSGCVVIVITAARQTNARSYRPHVGLACQIPVGNSP